MAEPVDCRWLLLFHQIPPKPNYFRVKIWRRLQRLGAVAVKNAVYALPRSEQAQEDLQWVLREISEGGGDATLCEVRLIDGLTDPEVEALFQRARDADYAQLADDARAPASSAGCARSRRSISSARPGARPQPGCWAGWPPGWETSPSSRPRARA